MVVRIRKIQHTDLLDYHPGQIQGTKLAHPQIYIICQHLGCINRQVLMIQGFRISVTQDNRITRGSPDIDGVTEVRDHKQDTRNMENTTKNQQIKQNFCILEHPVN